MSFKRLDQQDIVISADSVTAPAWTGNVVSLTSFYSSSAQASGISGDYYLNVYQAAYGSSNAAIQFSVGFGHLKGSGSADLNTQIDGNSPSKIVYGQYRTLVNGTEEENLSFASYTPNSIYPIAVERARFKEKILPGSLTLKLKKGSASIVLTDDSNYVSTQTFTDAGRVFNIISGSAGTRTSAASAVDSGDLGYTNGYGSYGLLLPDAGLIILNGDALDASSGAGGIGLTTGVTNTDEENPKKIVDALNAGGQFTLRSEETVSSNYVFIRARNSEFNYSTNPSNITGSGELRHNVMIDSPQAYITAVGLYNDNNDLLAVAKLSRPLLKDFTKEALIRIKLDY